jgi:nucleotide-binding universal stress UspA family protein
MFQRVLLAVDRSEAGRLVTSFAVALARAAGDRGAVRVVHVNEYLFGGRGHTVETGTEATEVVNDALAELRGAGVEATGQVIRATCFDVAAAIAAAAAEWEADVIVVGSHRRRFGFGRRRGLREQITSRTPLPVLVSPAPIALGRRRSRSSGRSEGDRNRTSVGS